MTLSTSGNLVLGFFSSGFRCCDRRYRDRNKPNEGCRFYAAVRGVRVGRGGSGQEDELERVGLPEAVHGRNVGRHGRLLPDHRSGHLDSRAPDKRRISWSSSGTNRHSSLVNSDVNYIILQGP